jgi:hypothetical protein
MKKERFYILYTNILGSRIVLEQNFDDFCKAQYYMENTLKKMVGFTYEIVRVIETVVC